VTHPEAVRMPVWTRRNLADASFVSANSALLPFLSGYQMAVHPATLRSSVSGGAFAATEAYLPASTDLLELDSRIESLNENYQEVSVDLGARGMVQDVGYSLFYSRRRQVQRWESGDIQMHYYRDIVGQMGVGGTLFDRPDLGRMEIGTGLKAIFRQGDEKLFSLAQVQAGQSFQDSDFSKWAFAGGLDYGWLYTAPVSESKDWIFQTGLSWKDVGTTPFFLGQKTSRNRRFEPLRNVAVLGLGLAVPKISGMISNSFRLEYSLDRKTKSLSEDIGVGYEVRFPVLLNLSFGLKGFRPCGGVGLRYSNIEIEAGTFTDHISSAVNSEEYVKRFWGFEMRAVL
jgi:hypothetical protein